MDYNEIKKLINDIGESKVDEVNLEFPDGIKISVKKNIEVLREEIKENTQKEVIENSRNTESLIVETEEDKKEEKCKVIKAPMVGTFYSKSSPTAETFVKVGDKVKKGQTLCIVEAMKLMNEIESEYDGEIVEVCVEDDTMVEFGQSLFKVK